MDTTPEMLRAMQRLNEENERYSKTIAEQQAEIERLRAQSEAFKTQLNEAIEDAENESGRWQEAIRGTLLKFAPDNKIDGAGCDSGDPLDFTLAEIHQAFGHVEQSSLRWIDAPIGEEVWPKVGDALVVEWKSGTYDAFEPIDEHDHEFFRSIIPHLKRMAILPK